MISVNCQRSSNARRHAPGPELAESRRIVAVLPNARASMSAVVVGVNGESAGRQVRDEAPVPSGMLPVAVAQLDDAARMAFGGVDVVDDRDAVRIDELGHGASLDRCRIDAVPHMAATSRTLSEFT